MKKQITLIRGVKIIRSCEGCPIYQSSDNDGWESHDCNLDGWGTHIDYPPAKIPDTCPLETLDPEYDIDPGIDAAWRSVSYSLTFILMMIEAEGYKPMRECVSMIAEMRLRKALWCLLWEDH